MPYDPQSLRVSTAPAHPRGLLPAIDAPAYLAPAVDLRSQGLPRSMPVMPALRPDPMPESSSDPSIEIVESAPNTEAYESGPSTVDYSVRRRVVNVGEMLSPTAKDASPVSTWTLNAPEQAEVHDLAKALDALGGYPHNRVGDELRLSRARSLWARRVLVEIFCHPPAPVPDPWPVDVFLCAEAAVAVTFTDEPREDERGFEALPVWIEVLRSHRPRLDRGAVANALNLALARASLVGVEALLAGHARRAMAVPYETRAFALFVAVQASHAQHPNDVAEQPALLAVAAALGLGVREIEAALT